MGSTKTQETKLPQWQEDFIRNDILPNAALKSPARNTPPTTGETDRRHDADPDAGAVAASAGSTWAVRHMNRRQALSDA